MNMNSSPTPDDLRDLLASCDDEAGHHIVWLDHKGDVHISRIENGETIRSWLTRHQHLLMERLETFQRGNGYVGPKAAEDGQHLASIYRQLEDLWFR